MHFCYWKMPSCNNLSFHSTCRWGKVQSPLGLCFCYSLGCSLFLHQQLALLLIRWWVSVVVVAISLKNYKIKTSVDRLTKRTRLIQLSSLVNPIQAFYRNLKQAVSYFTSINWPFNILCCCFSSIKSSCSDWKNS